MLMDRCLGGLETCASETCVSEEARALGALGALGAEVTRRNGVQRGKTGRTQPLSV
jgi:hypothetical protein